MIYFEQLGLYDQLLKVTKPFGSIRLKKENMAPIGTFEMKESKEEIRKRYKQNVRALNGLMAGQSGMWQCACF